MPWNRVLWNDIGNIPTQPVPWSETVLLFVLSLFINIGIRSVYLGWEKGEGKISKLEFEKRKQNKDFLSTWTLFSDGFQQIARFITFSKPLDIYKEESSPSLHPQLTPIVENLAWREQAKDLVSLKNSSFDFNPEDSWKNSQGVWIGFNLDTNNLICIYPTHEEIQNSQIDSVCRYAKKIANEKHCEVEKIIVTTKESVISKPSKKGFNLEYLTEEDLLKDLVDFKDYFHELKRRIVKETLPDSLLTLDDVYVKSKIHINNLPSNERNIEEYFKNWLLEPNQKHLALLGEYGQGKSTATLMWAYKTSLEKDPSRIPILIELRGKSPRNMDILGILGDWSARYRIDAQALMKLHIAGKLVLIFEGFDEMALVGDSEMRLKHFRTLWQFAYPKAKILITGRPNFFLDDNELKSALGISTPTANSPYCEAVRLIPFDENQMEVALRNHDSLTREQIVQLVKDKPDSRFAEIVSRPSLLHIVSTLWLKEKLSEKVDQLNSAFVMDLFVRHSFTRQGLKEQDSPEFMALTTNERQYFMSGIATSMSSEGSNQISSTQLSEIIRKLIEYIPDSISKESKTIDNESKTPLRERINQSEFTEEHIKTDVRTCGLLVDDPTIGNGFRFGHKSFLEFLFAKVIASHLFEKTPETISIMQATNSRVENILKVPTSIEFLNDLVLTKTQEEKSNLINKDPRKIVAGLFFGFMFRKFALSKTIVRNIINAAIKFQRISFFRKSETLVSENDVISSIRTGISLLMTIYITPWVFLMTYAVYFSNKKANFFTILSEQNGIGYLIMSYAYMMPVFFMTITMLLTPRISKWMKICKKLGLSENEIKEVLSKSFQIK